MSLRIASIVILVASLVIACGSKSKFASATQVDTYNALQKYMRSDRQYFLHEASTWNGEKAVETMTDILDHDIDAVLSKHNLTQPQDVEQLLMNMSMWVSIHKEKKSGILE